MKESEYPIAHLSKKTKDKGEERYKAKAKCNNCFFEKEMYFKSAWPTWSHRCPQCFVRMGLENYCTPYTVDNKRKAREDQLYQVARAYYEESPVSGYANQEDFANHFINFYRLYKN